MSRRFAMRAGARVFVAGGLAASVVFAGLPAAAVPGGPGSASTIGTLLAQPIGYSIVAPEGQAPGGLIVRSATATNEACPSLTVTNAADGTTTLVPLTERPSPQRTGTAYAGVLLCEVPVPAGATRSGTLTWANGRTQDVPTAISPVTQLAAIGDTGCRLVYNITQACDKPSRWPLARFGRDIAAARPDAIVHVGDYFYGDEKCPDPKACGDSPPPAKGVPFVSTAAGFVYQFLRPMAPALAVAPLLPVIGNEEVCATNGIAYYYFLDPHIGTSRTCDPVTRGGRLVAPVRFQPSFAVTLPLATGEALRIVVTDSTQADDQWVTSWAKRNRPRYLAAEALAAADAASQTWLVTHRPLFAVRPNWQCGFVCTPYSRRPGASFWVSSDTAAAAQGLLGRYSLILSGHVHLNEAVQVPGQPGQLVVGAGGTTLDPGIKFVRPKHGQLASGLGRPMSPDHTPYRTLTSWFHQSTFAWALMTAGSAPGSWDIEYRGADGRPTATCRTADRSVRCRAA